MRLQRPSSARHKRSSLGPKPSRFFVLTACLLLVGLTLALCARHTIGLGSAETGGMDDLQMSLPGEHHSGMHTTRLTNIRQLSDDNAKTEGQLESEFGHIHGMFGSDKPTLILGEELPKSQASSSQSEVSSARTPPTPPTAYTVKAEPQSHATSLASSTQADPSTQATDWTTSTGTEAYGQAAIDYDDAPEETATKADAYSGAMSISLNEDEAEEADAVDMSSGLGKADAASQHSGAADASGWDQDAENELPSMGSRPGEMGAREIDVRDALSRSTDAAVGEVFSVQDPDEDTEVTGGAREVIHPGSSLEAVVEAMDDDDEMSGDPRLQAEAEQASAAEEVVEKALPEAVPQQQAATLQTFQAFERPAGKTGVLFLMTGMTKEDMDSLRFFVRNAVSDQSVTFVLAVSNPSADLPALPPHAQYVAIPASPCQWGLVGKLLEGDASALLLSDYVIVVSSDLKGPFLPSYHQGSWVEAFTGRITSNVKLVGPILSCFPVMGTEALQAELAAPGGSLPFLHPSMFATDAEGLKLMRDNSVFDCPGVGPDNQRYPSVKASNVILGAGKSLDTLMLRYKGVNWRDPQYWDCNGQAEPTFMHSYDGEHLNPLEVMFVPVDRQRLYSGHPTAQLAKRYDRWQQELDKPNSQVSWNLYTMDPTTYRAQRMAYMQSRGPGCFDKAFYQSHSPDLAGFGAADLWEHFWKNGQFEGREYRFSCVDLKARGVGCFDGWYYITKNIDLNELRLAGNPLTPEQSWHHFVTDGQFSGRHYKFNAICGEDIDSPNSIDYSS